MSIEEYRYMDCAECGELVFAPVSEDNEWTCNRCDYKANPEDYADFTEKELVINGLWQGFGGGLDEEVKA